MKKLDEKEMQKIDGTGGWAYCGVAMGLAAFGGPVAAVGAALFCIAATADPAY